MFWQKYTTTFKYLYETHTKKAHCFNTVSYVLRPKLDKQLPPIGETLTPDIKVFAPEQKGCNNVSKWAWWNWSSTGVVAVRCFANLHEEREEVFSFSRFTPALAVPSLSIGSWGTVLSSSFRVSRLSFARLFWNQIFTYNIKTLVNCLKY